MSNPSTTSTTSTEKTNSYRFPENETFQNASKFAIVDDKPIMMDYWTASLNKTAFIGWNETTQEKLLVKSNEEYTSPVAKIYKIKTEYIVITENSIYLVDVGIPTRKITM